MKKKYLSPEMEIEKFTIDDVIKTTSEIPGGGEIQMDDGEY